MKFISLTSIPMVAIVLVIMQIGDVHGMPLPGMAALDENVNHAEKRVSLLSNPLAMPLES
jgi:hypothetical protein